MFSFRYPAVILLVFVIAGTLLGRAVNPGAPFLSALLIAAGLGLLFACFRLPREYFIYPLGLFALAAAFMGSALKYQFHPPDDVARLNDSAKPIRFFAQVDQWPVIKRNRTFITCRVDSVVVADSVKAASGLILLHVRTETTRFAHGDRISFIQRLYRPPSGGYPYGFDYHRYLLNQGIRAVAYVSDPADIVMLEGRYNAVSRLINHVRLWMLDSFKCRLTPTSAALAAGFLIGQTRDVPEELYQAFRRTGTIHLLAVSGSNVAMVLLVAVFGLRFFPMARGLRYGLLILIVALFSQLSYNQPSVVRAAVMAVLVLLAQGLYRRYDLNNLIAAAALLLIVFDPETCLTSASSFPSPWPGD